MSEGNTPGVRHVFDGIEEYDNRLPNWWLGLLWGSILFAFGYWFYYHPSRLGEDQLQAYASEKAEHDAKVAAATPKPPPGVGPEELIAGWAKDPAVLGQAKELFTQNCASCHGADGQGLVGPNLTDKFFLHGSKPGDIHTVVAKGKLEKGMPAWEPVLGAERTQKLAAYVISLKGKNLPGKDPQGEAME